jgi:hypothetical protein
MMMTAQHTTWTKYLRFDNFITLALHYCLNSLMRRSRTAVFPYMPTALRGERERETEKGAHTEKFRKLNPGMRMRFGNVL